ncbi:MAG: hypothetical protein RB292_01670 [Patescibacteria group bacterium]|jgi:hypothetical protein|nr:hypothetical protein [Patescibacteria group bacterium]
MVCAGFHDEDYPVCTTLAPAFGLSSDEQLRCPTELKRLLGQHLAEMDRLTDKLSLDSRSAQEQAKRNRQRTRLDHLRYHCVPFLVYHLTSRSRLESKLALDLRRYGCEA